MPSLFLAAMLAATAPDLTAEPRERQPLAIAGRSVNSGERFDIDLQIARGSDPATFIPLTVFHGSTDGPVLVLTMGVHG